MLTGISRRMFKKHGRQAELNQKNIVIWFVIEILILKF